MNFRYILFSLFALSFSAQTLEEDRWFDVEILVFKRNVDIQSLNEQLDQENVYLKQRQRLEVIQAEQATPCIANDPCLHQPNPVVIGNSQTVVGGHRLQRLDSSHLGLTGQREALEKHELFSPIMHVAWRMPIQNKANALPIHLFAGDNYALELYQKELQEKIQEPTFNNTVNHQTFMAEQNVASSAQPTQKLDALAALEKEETIQDLYEIDGNLLIYVERYLYVDSQLIVRTQTEKALETEVDLQTTAIMEEDMKQVENETEVEIVAQQPIVRKSFETETVISETLFDQRRRLRSEEIHYLDHPLFGILVQIRKIPEEQLPQE